MKNLLSRIFLVSGFLLVASAAYLLYLRHSTHPLTFEDQPKSMVAIAFGAPQKVQIPSINVNLPVIPSLIHNKTWETTDKGVSYLMSTPLPGEKGNSVMYGHNWTSLLKRLPSVKPGDSVLVTMENGTVKKFKVEFTATVNADQTYVIDNTEDSRLTIYTCVGFLDSKRFVVVAKPIS